MQRMSFNLTTQQVVNGRMLAMGLPADGPGKTVTRRLAHTWSRLEPGHLLLAVDKSMGLRAGERSKILAVIRVVSVHVEPLECVTQEDCARAFAPYAFGDQYS